MRTLSTIIGIFALTSSAMAADLPLKAPPPAPVVAAPQWTGFYVGANLGYAFSHNEASVVGNDPVFTGLIAGTFFAGGDHATRAHGRSVSTETEAGGFEPLVIVGSMRPQRVIGWTDVRL